MWLCLLWSNLFEKKTFENPQWRKVKQMQPMWLCFFSGRRFEDTFENPHWRKVIKMQPMWLCLFSCIQFEETYENAHWRKFKQMHPMWLCFFSGRRFEDTYEKHAWNCTTFSHTAVATFENTHKKRVDHFPEVSFGPFKPVCLDSHDNLAVHKSVQYGQDRMKIEGGGQGGGG